jgi:hypothetical protein
MPGTNDRQPSDVERPPASRVGDELQERAQEGADAESSEREAFEAAQEKGWDKPTTS